ncbi:hypothetical protein M231_05044 [Tremella mesenterica]|uniref:Uncharacterized protein n=1 Tax=Tremella mesenterica TaxID=5217 RepID=A0A4Q1BJ35_TREME|nr:hypothetical protein M231_05044 [Tremella mesenterica]
MSSTELIPLFPSATHPAIPIASQILSTLRSLTAPGRGNDLRSEERAALVGVSALLGIQSHDLTEQTAQKASSVSKTHFHSALSKSRRLLSTKTTISPLPSRTSKSSSRSPHISSNIVSDSTTFISVDDLDESSTKSLGSTSTTTNQVISNLPFTPKKKYKHISGIDISSLVKSPHSPARASPLRQSTTRITSLIKASTQRKSRVIKDPKYKDSNSVKKSKEGSKRVENNSDDELSLGDRLGSKDMEDEEDSGSDDELRLREDDVHEDDEESNTDERVGMEGEKTPTKSMKFGMKRGIDLESISTSRTDFPNSSGSKNKRRKQGDTTAFLALRPGSGIDVIPSPSAGSVVSSSLEGGPWVENRRLSKGKSVQNDMLRKEKRKKSEARTKRDWTYSERCWTDEKVTEENKIFCDQLWKVLPVWLEERSRIEMDRSTEKESDKGGNLLEILLNQ